METRTYPLELACDWCGTAFKRCHRIGRIPRYCGRTCRQRCYEHRRRGAQWPNLPAPPHPAPNVSALGPPAFYEGAPTMRGKCVRHGIRPYVPPDDRGMRTTLCGTSARVGKTPFMPTEWAACKTCAKVATRFPPARRVDSSDDLAHLLAEFERMRLRAGKATSADRLRDMIGGIWATALTHTGIGDQRLPSRLRTAA